jgi:hypothetical protein
MTTTITYYRSNKSSLRQDRYETFKAGVKVIIIVIISSACFVAYMYTSQNLPIDQIAFKLIGK